jgi:ubiquinone/menaquinone biosynthesis C-methylase UbiE
MIMRQWYEELFDNYAKSYDKESFTTGTVGEVDFLEQELNSDTSKCILDIGCGTGRHAIELAQRGYSVTGVDLSVSQLQRAREKVNEAGVSIEFIQHNACSLPFQQEFDLVIMICEGGFSLQETDELNFRILESAERALRSPGKFIFTALNALFPLYHNVKDFLNAAPTGVQTDTCSFDLMTFRDYATVTATDDAGKTKELKTDERYYAPSEISWYLKSLGFKKSSIHGCRLGNFSRKDVLTPDDFEMLVIAEK